MAYELKIKNRNRTLIKSNLGSEEPKHLLVCPDEILLDVVGEYYTRQEADKNSESKESDEEYTLEIKARYKKLTDERYFFNLLGEALWVVEDATAYKERLANSDCSEHPLTNENFYKDIR